MRPQAIPKIVEAEIGKKFRKAYGSPMGRTVQLVLDRTNEWFDLWIRSRAGAESPVHTTLAPPIKTRPWWLRAWVVRLADLIGPVMLEEDRNQLWRFLGQYVPWYISDLWPGLWGTTGPEQVTTQHLYDLVDMQITALQLRGRMPKAIIASPQALAVLRLELYQGLPVLVNPWIPQVTVIVAAETEENSDTSPGSGQQDPGTEVEGRRTDQGA